MFHKNPNQTTGFTVLVSHTSYIEHQLSVYFFKKLNFEMSISAQCHFAILYEITAATSLDFLFPLQKKIKNHELLNYNHYN